MNSKEYMRRLEFFFLDLVVSKADSLSSDDITQLYPLLEECAKTNFLAAFVLSVYWSRDGCMFPNKQEAPSDEHSLRYHNQALKLARNEVVEVKRAQNIIKMLVV